LGINLNGLLDQRQCPLVLTLLVGNNTEQVQRVAVARIAGKDAAIDLFCVG
jgi:hypothetical protein